jgi:hypothetical protein
MTNQLNITANIQDFGLETGSATNEIIASKAQRCGDKSLGKGA